MDKYSREKVLKSALKYFKGEELPANVWINKYALKDSEGNIYEQSPDDMHMRIAKEIKRIEDKYPNPMSEIDIYESIKDFKYIVPQGSPMAGIGNEFQISSISNCFVVGAQEKEDGNAEDSYGSVLKTDQEIIQLCKRRAGVGTTLEHIRPSGSSVKNAALTSTGVVPFMERYSNSIREVAQCLHKDTQVLTKNGLKSIKYVDINDEVWSENGWTKVINKLKNEKNTIKVRTKFGNEIICSEDHVFHTLNGEKKIKDINVGDIVSMINGVNNDNNLPYLSLIKPNMKNRGNRLKDLSTPEYLNEDLAYLLGYMYGDGSIYKKISKFTNNHIGSDISFACDSNRINIINKLKKIYLETFGHELSVKETSGKWTVLRTTSQYLYEFLKQNNILKEKSKDIVFPELIKNSNNSVQFSFISGYFDADGSYSKKKKSYRFGSINENFLNNIKIFFQSNGIISKIHREDRSKKSWQDMYVLSIPGASSKTKFYKNMKKYSCKINENELETNRDCFVSIYKNKDILIENNYNEFNYVPDNSQYLSLNTIERLKNEGIKLKNECNLYQDEIISKEFYEKKSEVYDLTLEHTHLFWANGFYVHNSGRRGALMLSTHVKSIDSKSFIDAKLDTTKVTGANISVKIDDDFMHALRTGGKYIQQFPINSDNPEQIKEINPKEIWDKLIYNNWSSAEPGILFWDTIERESIPDCYADLGFKSIGTNPCGEIVLCDADSCRLLLLNLFSFVENPFTKDAKFNFEIFEKYVRKAQRYMDDIVDIELEQIDKILNKIESDPESEETKFYEKNLWIRIKNKCQIGRRTGTGVTGEGDMLAALGLKYGTKEASDFSEKVHQELALNAFRESVNLAKERGKFSVYDSEREKNNPFLNRLFELDPQLKEDMENHGRRNIALLTIAPAGSVSILTQTTSGIEPLFSPYYKRRRKINPNDKDSRVDFVDDVGDSWQEYVVFHPRFLQWARVNNINIDKDSTDEELQEAFKHSPYYGACANDIDWVESISLQGRVQKFVDHSISKTVNLPLDTTVEMVDQLYRKAHEVGCKGITVYRDGSRSGVLVSSEDKKEKKKEEETKKVNEIIKETQAPRRPKNLECDVLRFVNKGEKWIGFVGLLEGYPYEIFTGIQDSFPIPGYLEKGIIRKYKNKETGEKRYDFVYTDKDGYEQEIKGLSRAFNKEYWDIAKMISAVLRHGMPVPHVINLLDTLHVDGEFVGTWKSGVKRMLKKYIKDEVSLGEGKNKCPECGEESLVFQDGCVQCMNPKCGYSKCG